MQTGHGFSYLAWHRAAVAAAASNPRLSSRGSSSHISARRSREWRNWLCAFWFQALHRPMGVTDVFLRHFDSVLVRSILIPETLQINVPFIFDMQHTHTCIRCVASSLLCPFAGVCARVSQASAISIVCSFCEGNYVRQYSLFDFLNALRSKDRMWLGF